MCTACVWHAQAKIAELKLRYKGLAVARARRDASEDALYSPFECPPDRLALLARAVYTLVYSHEKATANAGPSGVTLHKPGGAAAAARGGEELRERTPAAFVWVVFGDVLNTLKKFKVDGRARAKRAGDHAL